MIISKNFNSKLTQPNILNDLAPFEEWRDCTLENLKFQKYISRHFSFLI
ncbi:MAG: hypothetical protein Q7S59_03550 [Sulfurimonas sp.]|nr:hypothetical protein [Sulfurimonas sp.]